MSQKKHILGVLLGATLVVSGIVLIYFISNTYEWRPSLEIIQVGSYSTTIFTENLWGIGEQYRGTYLLQAVRHTNEYPYVVYGSVPKIKVYDQTENLIFSVVLQPTQLLFQNIDIENSGYYTFVLEDVNLRSDCYLTLKAYRNNRVYPYGDLWIFGLIFALIGGVIVGISLRKTLKK